MSQTALSLPVDIDAYLQGELSSDTRHEYVAGQVFAMAGAGEAHNRIAGNLFFHLRSATRGTPCGVFISDMKVRVKAHEAFDYPDVLLTCDPDDRESLYKTAPCLIAEVLSPSTEVIERRAKRCDGDRGETAQGPAAVAAGAKPGCCRCRSGRRRRALLSANAKSMPPMERALLLINRR